MAWAWMAMSSVTLWGQGAPAATEATAPRIVILGDSLTAGYGLTLEEAYPALLQAKIQEAGLPFAVANAGVSGDTTASGVRRIDWALSRGADVLILALGANDGLRGVASQEMAANLKAILRKARSKNPQIAILLAGIRMPENMGPAFTGAFAAVFPQVAQETGATLIPDLLEGVAGIDKMNQPDRIHPNAEGQRRIAENVWPILHRVLVPSPAPAGAD
jgi:acyl-CoA thioesterase I